MKRFRQISNLICAIIVTTLLVGNIANAQNSNLEQNMASPMLVQHSHRFNDLNNLTARRSDRDRYNNHYRPGYNRPNNHRDRDQGQYGDRLYCELTNGAVALNNRVYYINDLKFHINRKNREVKFLNIEARNTLQTIGSVRLVAYDGVVGICNAATQSDKDCAFLVGNYDTYHNGETKQVIAMSYFITGMLTCRFY